MLFFCVSDFGIDTKILHLFILQFENENNLPVFRKQEIRKLELKGKLFMVDSLATLLKLK